MAERYMAHMDTSKGSSARILRVYLKAHQHNPYMIGSDYVFDNFRSPIMPSKLGF